MKRAALYIRVSTEEQKIHGLSVETQIENLDAWAKQARVKIVDHYVDAGISARKKSSNRPALQRLLNDVRERKIDLIVFTKLDRWFRNVSEYYRVQDILDDYGVAWKTIHEDYDTTTASGRLKVNIMLSVAQDEADRTSERIKKIFEAKKARGEPVTGNVPTGYMIDGKRIIKDPSTEQAVTAYFEHYLKYGSISKAIDSVASEYGLFWKYQLASSMLSKSAYYGDFNGVECPAYISMEQHAQIVAKRRKTARKTIKNRTYLFSGLLVCGECGARMGARTHKYKTVENVEYNCPGHYQKKGCENRVNIREASIEEYLLYYVEDEIHRIDVKQQSDTSRKRDYAAEISSIKKKLTRLKDLYLNDLMDLDAYRTDYNQLTDKLNALVAERNRAPASVEFAKRAIVKGWKTVYEDLDRPGKRAFWQIVLSEIRVYSDRHIEFDILLN